MRDPRPPRRIHNESESHRMPTAPSARRPADPLDLLQLYRRVRADTARLAAPLSDADATVQSMPDASPAKWHLAHTTWFFETMVAVPNSPRYRLFDDRYGFLFNSYYETVGARQPRPLRGMLTRPTLEEVAAYRSHVDSAVETLLESGPSAEVLDLVELGCHHEQQHQELLLTDILHLFAQNPLRPAYRPAEPADATQEAAAEPARFHTFGGGIVEIGHGGDGFAFDCEGPRHRTLIEPYALADRLVTNGEWIAFLQDGGYRDPLLWLSEGWAKVQADGWRAPLYWEERDGEYWTMTLRGMQPVDRKAPVVHVSYFEADAFAHWAGARLPGEAEWEHAATSPAGRGLRQLSGDAWQWTRSAFAPYPRFAPSPGAVGEYNGKFMCGQFVLRGGSCATPDGHSRASYRNFFPPSARWQFSGLRLARDA